MMRALLVGCLGVPPVAAPQPQQPWFFAPSTERIFLDSLAPADAPAATMSLAHGEQESFQIAVRWPADGPAAELPVALEWRARSSDNSTARQNASSGLTAHWGQVGFVWVESIHRNSQNQNQSWWPDPILPVARLMVEPNTTASILVTVSVTPAANSAGDHVLDVRVATKLAASVDVHVESFVLPKKQSLKTKFELNPWTIKDCYERGGLSSAEGIAMLEKHQLWVLTQLKVQPTPFYFGGPQLTVEQALNLRGEGLTEIPISTIGTWMNLSTLVHEAETIFAPYIAQLVDAGVPPSDLSFYGFDEARGNESLAQMAQSFGYLKQRFPLVRTSTTNCYIADSLWSHNASELPLLLRKHAVDDLYSHLTVLYPAMADALEQAGRQPLTYASWLPRLRQTQYATGQTVNGTNFRLENPLVDVRVLMGYQLFAARQVGFLYWSLMDRLASHAPLNVTAMRSPRLDRGVWNLSSDPSKQQIVQGDGELYYPGVDGPLHSLRSVAIRDGVEDFQYLALLAERLGSRVMAAENCLPVASTGLGRHTRSIAVLLRARAAAAQMLETLPGIKTDETAAAHASFAAQLQTHPA